MSQKNLKCQPLSLNNPNGTSIIKGKHADIYFVSDNPYGHGDWVINVPGKDYFNFPLYVVKKDMGRGVIVREFNSTETHALASKDLKKIEASSFVPPFTQKTWPTISEVYLSKVNLNDSILDTPVFLEVDYVRGGLAEHCGHVMLVTPTEKDWTDVFANPDPEPIKPIEKTFTLKEMKVFGLKAALFGAQESQTEAANYDKEELTKAYNEWFADLEKVFVAEEVNWNEVERVVSENTRSKVQVERIINTLKKLI